MAQLNDKKLNDQIRKKYQSLVKTIREANQKYYVLDQPTITDFEYDQYFQKLVELEELYPTLMTPDSPTQKVGGEVLDHFEKAEHRIPMLSLQNTFSQEEVIAFHERIQKNLNSDESITYFCEPKLDGLAIELIYENGVLTGALTRGDGQVGESVLSNIKTIRSVPLKLNGDKFPELLEVRGEVIIPKKDFQILNEKQQEAGQQTFANPRNAAAGTVRQLDSKIAASRPLNMYCYSFGECHGLEFPTQDVFFETISAFHIPTLQLATNLKSITAAAPCFITDDIEQVLEYYKKINSLRNQLPYDIDGVVVKVNDIKLQKSLGQVARSPRWAFAVKFKPEQATTTIKDIIIQVGRTGALTPVAVMEPVKVSGVTVSNATLHNQSEIDRKDVRKGDTVVIQRAGDVIPEVVQVLVDKRKPKSAKFKMPTKCPECQQPVELLESEVILRCVNTFCPAILRQSLKHFVSRRAMNVDKLGDKIIDQLFEHGLIKNFSDLYKLQFDQIKNLERQGDKSAQNIIDSIDQSKSVTLGRFVYALGIRFVGEQTAQALADHFKNLEALLETSQEELLEIEDVGPRVAESILKAFLNKAFTKDIRQMIKLGVEIQNPEKNTLKQTLEGLNIVVTGTLPTPRSEVKSLIKKLGGKSAGSISKTTDYLLAGDNAGSKLDKAQKLEVKILSWDDFQKLIKS